MPDCENWRISARVPRRSGAWSPSIGELDLRLAVVGDLDALHRADRDAAHLHRVALHQLTGVQEARLDLVAARAAAAEEDQGDQHHGSDQRANSGYASDSAQRSHLLPYSSRTSPGPPPSRLADLPSRNPSSAVNSYNLNAASAPVLAPRLCPAFGLVTRDLGASRPASCRSCGRRRAWRRGP